MSQQLVNDLTARVSALVAERDEWKRAADAERKRARRAERIAHRLANALRESYMSNDPSLSDYAAGVEVQQIIDQEEPECSS